ncbi:MAG: hypothetical protein LBM98_05190 [Oscillospiraceae bacterium]|nr:hypothetical protein [Oscillospiraceae bacterium]
MDVWLRGYNPRNLRPTPIPSVEGCRPQAAGWFPGAVRRHCEAPPRPRYVGRYRCEAIQCRGDNIRLAYRTILRQPWIASPRFNSTYRKCGGGFEMTGRAKPCPVPAQCAGTVDGATSAHGAWRAGLKPAPTFIVQPVPRNLRPTPIPSVEGCPRRGGVVSRAVRGI